MLASLGGHTLLLLNPPFFARHMEALASSLGEILSASPRNTLPADDTLAAQGSAATPSPSPRITALVVVPSMGARQSHEVPHLEAIARSPFLRARATLASGEHSYCQGLAHRRTSRRWLKSSAFDTDVYVLSSHRQPPSTEQAYQTLLDAVTDAFGQTLRSVRHHRASPSGRATKLWRPQTQRRSKRTRNRE